jgi:putative membrane protein
MPRPRTRDHLANERTFLAWVRTAVALMTFGFVVDKFDLFLRLEVFHGRAPASHPVHSVLGLGLVASGLVILVLSHRHFTHVRDGIREASDRPAARASLPVTVTVLLVIVGLILMAYLWLAPG